MKRCAGCPKPVPNERRNVCDDCIGRVVTRIAYEKQLADRLASLKPLEAAS
jgi:rRNA maturation endonuclease Nob1